MRKPRDCGVFTARRIRDSNPCRRRERAAFTHAFAGLWSCQLAMLHSCSNCGACLPEQAQQVARCGYLVRHREEVRRIKASQKSLQIGGLGSAMWPVPSKKRADEHRPALEREWPQRALTAVGVLSGHACCNATGAGVHGATFESPHANSTAST
jgi:hypothetical protein